MLSPDDFDNLIPLDEDQIIVTYSLPKIMSLQNSRRIIALVQKAARATNRKQKAKDILRQVSRDSNNNSEDKTPTPAPVLTKSKGKGKAKNKADNTRKNLRKRAKKI
jgi:hypothetical protein